MIKTLLNKAVIVRAWQFSIQFYSFRNYVSVLKNPF